MDITSNQPLEKNAAIADLPGMLLKIKSDWSRQAAILPISHSRDGAKNLGNSRIGVQD
jgi:hypothetical protein